MLGYSVTELTGSHIHQQIHHSYSDGSPYKEKSCRMFAAVAEGKPQFVDDEVLWRNGEKPERPRPDFRSDNFNWILFRKGRGYMLDN